MAAWRSIGWVFGVLLLAGSALGAPIRDAEIPEDLRPWKDWVLRGHEEARCPVLLGGDERRCAWPSRLDLELDEAGGRFEQEWQVFAEASLPLPGDARRWPTDVTVDGRPAPVVTSGELPFVVLEPGRHVVRGSFRWDALPEILSIPAETGLVALRIDGGEVPFPNREPDGQLWLRRREQAPEEARLEVVVHRRVMDEVPLRLLSRIELRVAGKSREVELGKAVPAGFVPMSLDGPLPARLDPETGSLRVQVRPGRWMLDLLARHDGPAARLSPPPLEAPWSEEEVWVFDARPNLRIVSVEGVPAVDPQRTELPHDWRALPAYLVKRGDVMELVEKRRGDADPAPDRLSLARTWWLDFDGGGLTFHDVVSGTMSRSWRLEMAPPADLGRVAVDGEDQLVTRLTEGERAGVEIRRSQVRVEADGRIERTGSVLPAVSWSHDVQDLRIDLRLPPGWRLFRADGVDDVSSSWLTDWTLLDLFLVLVTAMAVARLFGFGWGAVAIVTLALLWREHDAPGVLWLFVLAGVALVRVVPEGRFARLARIFYLASFVTLVLVAIPFVVQQVRQGIWPALERPHVQVMAPPQAVTGGIAAPAEQELMLQRERSFADYAEDRAKSVVRNLEMAPAAAPAPARRLPRLDPDAIVQTGPGLPRWNWSAVTLGWKGPVDPAHEITLTLVSPRASLFLALLRVALTAALLFCVGRVLAGGLRTFAGVPGGTPGAGGSAGATGPRGATGATGAALGVAMLSSLVVPAAARADFPPNELLEQLRARLLEPEECHPQCASAGRLALEARGETLRLRLEVDAAAGIGVPLPGARSWIPRSVVVDGEPATALVRHGDGALWLELAPGRHQIVLEGPLPPADRVEIPLPLRPHRAEATVEGWEISGIGEDGRPGDALQLSRLEPREDAPDELRPAALPPFVRIDRTLRLGISPEAHTTISRLTPPGTPVVLEVPLLPGESVTTSDVRVENGRALVSLGPNAGYVAWSSILERTGSLALTSPKDVAWHEVWRVEASPIWHVEAAGIPEVHQPPHGGERTREWQPWPGETVTLAITRPEAVAGRSLTIDRAAIVATPGRRATDVTLTLEIRSSRGARHPVTLPEGSDLQSVSIDGAPQPIRQDERTVTLPLRPGAQTAEIVWREPRGIGTRFQGPDVDLGAPAVNAEVRVVMPRERWTLFLGGGLLGPAVLFWSTLVVLVLVAAALGRVRLTPLGAVSWFLLGIGLSQVSIGVAAVVAGWLLALGWRRERGPSLTDGAFDLAQLVLAGWTLVALGGLVSSVQQGLLGLPEMQITGNGSHAYDLRWFFDRSNAGLPRPWIVSVPLLAYRLAMLAWALWLAWAFIGWTRWAWASFSEGGLWRTLPVRRPSIRPPAAPPPAKP